MKYLIADLESLRLETITESLLLTGEEPVVHFFVSQLVDAHQRHALPAENQHPAIFGSIAHVHLRSLELQLDMELLYHHILEWIIG